jgi:dihydrofolate synthase / folylpolyglutamate synthase
MRILIIDNESKHSQHVAELLSEYELTEMHWSEFQYKNDLPYDLIVLTGSQFHAVVKSSHVYGEQETLLRESTIPIIGICAGFELIAAVFGCRLERRDEKIQGVYPITPLIPHRMFRGLHNPTVYEGHRWIVPTVSSELLGIARSEHGYEIIKHTKKTIYGFQFHPEVAEGNLGGTLFKNLVEELLYPSYEFPMPPVVKEVVYSSFLAAKPPIHGLDKDTRNSEFTQELFEAAHITFDNWKKVAVTGSKGKGSTAISIASLLNVHGKKVGLITSPHLRSFNERIRIDGKAVSDADLIEAATIIKPHVEKIISRIPSPRYLGPTGVILAIAALIFKKYNIDAVVAEVGRGGEHDETRLIKPDVSVLTPIFEEHVERLGRVEEIARTKTRIASLKSVIVSSSQSALVKDIVQKTAAEIECQYIDSLKWSCSTVASTLGSLTIRIDRQGSNFTSATITSSALFLCENIAVALEAVSALYPDLSLKPQQVTTALERICWYGKGQLLQSDAPILLDGATHPQSKQFLQHLPAGTKLLTGNQSYIAEILTMWGYNTSNVW